MPAQRLPHLRGGSAFLYDSITDTPQTPAVHLAASITPQLGIASTGEHTIAMLIRGLSLRITQNSLRCLVPVNNPLRAIYDEDAICCVT